MPSALRYISFGLATLGSLAFAAPAAPTTTTFDDGKYHPTGDSGLYQPPPVATATLANGCVLSTATPSALASNEKVPVLPGGKSLKVPDEYLTANDENLCAEARTVGMSYDTIESFHFDETYRNKICKFHFVLSADQGEFPTGTSSLYGIQVLPLGLYLHQGQNTSIVDEVLAKLIVNNADFAATMMTYIWGKSELVKTADPSDAGNLFYPGDLFGSGWTSGILNCPTSPQSYKLSTLFLADDTSNSTVTETADSAPAFTFSYNHGLVIEVCEAIGECAPVVVTNNPDGTPYTVVRGGKNIGF